jgi:hypothetical protein
MKDRGITQTIYVPPLIHEAIQKRAKEQKRSFSAITVELLQERLQQEEKQERKDAC